MQRNSRKVGFERQLSFQEGLNTFSSETGAQETQLRKATNVMVGADGVIRHKPGFQVLSETGLDDYESIYFVKTTALRCLLANESDTVWKLTSLSGSWSAVKTDATTEHPYSYVTSSNRRVYGANGVVADAFQLADNGSAVYMWGIAAPTVALAAPNVSLAGALTFVNGGRLGAYAWKNSQTGHISNVKLGTDRTGNISGKKIRYTVPTTGAPDDVDKVVIFETTDGTDNFYLSGEVTYGTATYDSEVTDTVLLAGGVRAPIFDNFPPPPGNLVERYKGRIFVSGIVDEPSFCYFSDDPFSKANGVAEESFSQYQDNTATRRFSIPGQGETISGLKGYADRLWIFTEDRCYWFYGDDEFTFAQPREAAIEHGTRSNQSIVKTTRGIAWFSSDKKIFISNGNSPEPYELSKPIRDQLTDVNPTTVCGAYYSYGNVDLLVFTGRRKDETFFQVICDISTDSDAWVVFDDGNQPVVAVWEAENGDKLLVAGTDSDSEGKLVQVLPLDDETPTGNHPDGEFSTKFLAPQGLGVDGFFRYIDFFVTDPDLNIEVRSEYNFKEDVNGGDILEVEQIDEFQFRAWVKPGKENSRSVRFTFKFIHDSVIGGIYAINLCFTSENITQ